MRTPSHTTILFFVGTVVTSCSTGPEVETAPYGYDPSFDYLAILQSSPEYAFEPTAGYPQLSYQESSDDSLTALRLTYRLDSIAGDGDEISKILNLLFWASHTLSHDGSGSSPDPETSLNILRHVEVTGSGLNCVMKAIVLNDAYLAMGFKSRVVHGNGRDWVFNGEWHAFNAVYSYSLGKWLFVDPTNAAYFTDSGGNLLSVAEVRESLRQDSQVLLNDDAEYNGRPVDLSSYLHYLSKNLYRFSCAAYSAFGRNAVFHPSSISSRTFVNLDPDQDAHDGKGGAANYFTRNPEYYWQRP
jgi:hypothetical protein